MVDLPGNGSYFVDTDVRRRGRYGAVGGGEPIKTQTARGGERRASERERERATEENVNLLLLLLYSLLSYTYTYIYIHALSPTGGTSEKPRFGVLCVPRRRRNLITRNRNGGGGGKGKLRNVYPVWERARECVCTFGATRTLSNRRFDGKRMKSNVKYRTIFVKERREIK